MKLIRPRYPLYLKLTEGKGWGVFCSRKIPKGRVFEVDPIIYIPKKHFDQMSDTPVESYRFEYRGWSTAIVLGYGSLINHSSKKANCSYRINFKSRTYSFYATKDIPAHTEIFHDYNWDEDDYEKRMMQEEENA